MLSQEKRQLAACLNNFPLSLNFPKSLGVEVRVLCSTYKIKSTLQQLKRRAGATLKTLEFNNVTVLKHM